MSIDNFVIDFNDFLCVSNEPNLTSKCHPRFDLYKHKRSDERSQNERRTLHLETQKKNREKLLMEYRQLISPENSDESTSHSVDDGDERMEQIDDDNGDDNGEVTKNGRKFKRKKKRFNKYKNQLMLSEWFVDVPHDFPNEWFMVLCPIGKRCMIVASRGETKVYAKNGFLVNAFPSLLPGGNKCHSQIRKDNCILDCIYNESERIYYIIDIIWWNGVSFHDSETEFRFYWFHTKCAEMPQITNRDRLNPYPFIPLNYYSCETEVIKSAVKSPYQFKNEIDGVLFYHKRVHYSRGVTPLVCWLKLEMIPQILNISIQT